MEERNKPIGPDEQKEKRIVVKKRPHVPLPGINKKTILAAIVMGCFAAIMFTTTRFTITGDYEGIFLLKGERGRFFELKDDLFLGEGSRYIIGIDLEPGKRFLYSLMKAWTMREPYLYFEWNEKKGAGFIRNYMPGGKQMLTCFSRFKEDGKKETSGLFVGGGLPANVRDDDSVKENETGMAYFDGTRWFHIWCNENEGIVSDKMENIYPPTWRFLGSKILHANSHDLILESRHEVTVDGVPLLVDRHAHFEAGAPYFVLTISITNIGTSPMTYYYFYGDEPWLGNYGTSGGNVGWSAEGIYEFVSVVNTQKTNYAGLFDYGNDVIGEGHHFTLASNFIEWFGKVKPLVYFSNGPFDTPLRGNKRTPLKSNTRFIGIEWGPRTLRPDQSERYTIAIGMAGLNSFPVKPDVNLKAFP